MAQPNVTGRSGLAGGPTLRWPAVAARYQALASRLLGEHVPVSVAKLPA
jgi:hypothetical protein